MKVDPAAPTPEAPHPSPTRSRDGTRPRAAADRHPHRRRPRDRSGIPVRDQVGSLARRGADRQHREAPALASDRRAEARWRAAAVLRDAPRLDPGVRVRRRSGPGAIGRARGRDAAARVLFRSPPRRPVPVPAAVGGLGGRTRRRVLTVRDPVLHRDPHVHARHGAGAARVPRGVPCDRATLPGAAGLHQPRHRGAALHAVLGVLPRRRGRAHPGLGRLATEGQGAAHRVADHLRDRRRQPAVRSMARRLRLPDAAHGDAVGHTCEPTDQRGAGHHRLLRWAHGRGLEPGPAARAPRAARTVRPDARPLEHRRRPADLPRRPLGVAGRRARPCSAGCRSRSSPGAASSRGTRR